MIDNLFMCVGAMRSSTTWLHAQLKDHPQIYFTPVKEIHYFAHARKIYDFESKANRLKWLNVIFSEQEDQDHSYFASNARRFGWFGRYVRPEEVSDDWYQSLFVDRQDEKYCADFSNLNSLLDEEGWKLVRKNCRKLKVIYVLRDPLERAWSHYKHEMKWNGLSAEVREGNFELFRETVGKDWFWEQARYDLAINRLRASLGDDEFRVFYFEDLHSRPKESLRELCDFLEIEPCEDSIDDADERVNASTSMEIPTLFAIHLHDRLKAVYDDLQKMGFSHPQWRSYLNSFPVENQLLRNALDESERQLATTLERISTLESDYVSRNDDIARLQMEYQAISKQSKCLEVDLLESASRIREIESESSEKFGALELALAEYRTQNGELNRVILARDEEIASLSTSLDTLREEASTSLELLEAREKVVVELTEQISRKDQDIDALRANKSDFESRESRMKQAISEYEATLEQLRNSFWLRFRKF
jgi:predicted  nucleic acid-binding Zn-ribbon protein